MFTGHGVRLYRGGYRYAFTPPLSIAHAITLRASPPQGHPNTTLLGFRVCPQTPGRLKYFLSLCAQSRRPCNETKRDRNADREAPGRQERTAWEPGKQERTRTTGTAWEAPGRHLGGTREAGKDYWDSLGGTREAPGRQERTSWTVWEAPGRQERTIWTAWEARGRHQGGRKGLTGQPARHQGGRKGTGSSLPLSPVRSQNGV